MGKLELVQISGNFTKATWTRVADPDLSLYPIPPNILYYFYGIMKKNPSAV